MAIVTTETSLSVISIWKS